MGSSHCCKADGRQVSNPCFVSCRAFKRIIENSFLTSERQVRDLKFSIVAGVSQDYLATSMRSDRIRSDRRIDTAGPTGAFVASHSIVLDHSVAETVDCLQRGVVTPVQLGLRSVL